MIFQNNFGVIVNDKGKNYCLPLINLAEFPNYSIIKGENAVEYGEYNIKKVYNDHTVVEKRLKSNILY